MAFGGHNPGLWGESVRNALNPGEEQNADDRQMGVKRRSLDDAELRELEGSELYGATPQPAQPARRRSILDRLFRRPA